MENWRAISPPNKIKTRSKPITRRSDMAFSSLQALLIVLLACILRGVVATTSTTEQDKGKCRLKVENPVEFTIPTIEHNGQTFNDVAVTIDTTRGYMCKEGLSSSSRICESSYIKNQNFMNSYNQASNQLEDTMSSDHQVRALCIPKVTNDVSQAVDVQVGSATVSVNIVWRNITSCKCYRYIV